MQSLQLDVHKTIFDNGLTLVTLEKHDIPIVTSTIWYRVGSANEHSGETGISHFLEHLMFKGTQTCPKGGIDSLTAAYGGYNNAGTIFDYTMYNFNFSSDRWEIALEIEADRMRHCAFVSAEIEAERKVVLEELKQQKDSPWGELGIQIESTMFPAPPYHHPVIGWQTDIERLSRYQIIDYYNTYYVPNNATLVIVGDVTTSAVIEKVHHYFAHISPNPHLPTVMFKEPGQQEERRCILYQDSSVKRVQIGYHTVQLADEDTYTLEVIDSLLSHGKTSRLYQRFMEQDHSVTFIDSYNHPRRLSGVFYLFAALRPEVSPESFEQALDEEIYRLQTEPVSREELQKTKYMIAADYMFDKETTSGLAHALGEYEMLHTYEYFYSYAERIEQISPEDVMRGAQKYLNAQHRTVGWALPEHSESKQFQSEDIEEFFAPPPTDMVFHTSPCSHNIPDEQSNLHTLTLKSVPELLVLRTIQPFHHHRWTLDNGLTVLFLEQHVLPIVSIDAFVDAGQKYETDAQAGVTVLTGQLLDEGTHSRSSIEIAHTIESVGGSLDTESQGGSVQVLAADVALGMELLADVLINPIFDPQQLEKKRHQLLGSLDEDEDHLSAVALHLFREMVYGPHPYHRPRKGYKDTVSGLTRQEIVTHHAAYFRPNNTILAIVGDAEPARIIDEVCRCFGAWEYQDIPSPLTCSIPLPKGRIQKHIAREREQVHLYLGHVGVTRTNPDFYTLFTMDHILGIGAGFTDRISKKLRDELGLAYTVTANITLSAEKEPGIFAAYISTSPDNVHQAVDGFLAEIRRIQAEPVSSDELEVAQKYITGSYIFHFETSSQLARYLINVERYQLGEDFIRNFPERILCVTIEDIQQAARQYLDPENYYLASAGKIEL